MAKKTTAHRKARPAKAAPPRKTKVRADRPSKASQKRATVEKTEIVAPAKPPIDIRHVCGFVQEIAGPQGMKIVECLGDGATDEVVEEKTDLKIAEVRSILNHLHSYGVVEYSREKNMSNGWFTYTWKANPERAMQNYLALKKREYDALKRQAVGEDGATVYKCRRGCHRLSFEDAMDTKFRCPKCNSNLVHSYGGADLSKIEREISSIERVLARPGDDGIL